MSSKEFHKLGEYSGSPYVHSLPSPPYSEDETDSSAQIFSDSNRTSSKTASNLKVWNYDKFYIENKCSTKPPPNSSKIYPNLTKHFLNDNCDEPLPKKKLKRSKAQTTTDFHSPKSLHCYVCQSDVKKSEIEKHLYFGSVKCKDCGWIEEYCPNFSSFDFIAKVSTDCQHCNLVWYTKPIQNLKKWLNVEEKYVTKKPFQELLSQYIELLHPLNDLYPWNKAIDICNRYISSRKEKLTNSFLNDEELLTPSKREKNLIHMPADGNYLIVKDAIEECPNCYECLDITRLTFNIDTGLIDIVCECGLYIYFVLDPPDGSDPKIVIDIVV